LSDWACESVSMPSVQQASRPSCLITPINSATFSMSRSFGARQAAPMQKRLAPASRAAITASRTSSGDISLLASTPVSYDADCGQ